MPTAFPQPPLGRDPATRRATLTANLAANWWIVALRGVLGLLFGLLTFVSPGVTIATLVLFFSAYMFIDGFVAIGAAVRAAQKHERWGLLVLEGFADVLAGMAAFLWPAITAIVFVYLIAGWAIVSGLVLAIAGFQLHAGPGRWTLILAGIVSLAFGVVLLVSPLMGAVVLAYWIGAYALIFGAVLIAFALRLRTRHGARSI